MKKHEFLAKLEKETDNKRLVEYYEELIADRVATGEDEQDIVASFDIKRIIRTAELEKANTGKKDMNGGNTNNFNVNVNVSPYEQSEPRTKTEAVKQYANSHGFLIASILAFVVAIAMLIPLIYGIAELVEELTATRRDDEWYEYIIWIVVSSVVMIGALITGFIMRSKHKAKQRQ